MFKKLNNKVKKHKKRTTKTLRPAIKKEISSSVMSEENLELLGLKLKMLAVDCGKHEKWRVFRKVPNYVYYLNNIIYEIVKAHNIYERLTVSSFEHYSSVLIFINCQNARCRRKSLCTIIKAIRRNKRIRNQLKMIWASYKGYSDAFTPDILFHSMFEDFFIFKSKQLENTFLFQDHFERKIQVLLHLLTSTPFAPAQEIQQLLKSQYLLIQLKSTAPLYFYGVNPQLVIIINNYYFTNSDIQLDNREGSCENDVMGLISTFIETRTPYIVINDMCRTQILEWTQYLCRKDMTNLQNLFFFTLTHGSSNNIIYTNDGEVDFIKDIVQPIQENVTLRKTKITFINVHCRGQVRADCAAPDAFGVKPTRIENLRKNITILFSVPESMISPRYPTEGTPVIKSFNRIFCSLESPTNIRILHEKIWSLVKNDDYYQYLDAFETSTELVVGDCPHDDADVDNEDYNIKPIPTNPKKILPLFSAIETDCPNLDLKCKIENLTQHKALSDSKSFCLYNNVKGNVFDDKGSQLKHFTGEKKTRFGEKESQLKDFTEESDSADEWDDEWDSDDDESDDDQEDKRKAAEIEFRKLILPFMGSTILQDENIFALDSINRDDEDNRDDFGIAILDYRTLIKAFDYELGIEVERY